MKCPACTAPVRPGLVFCDSCGARLERACARCAAKSPLGSRFCGMCGAAFEPETAPVSSAEEGERRQLTVMFVDLVRSTSLSASLDPEEWRDILRAYQGVCAEAITRFGGKIQQYAGDGVFAYFGYPVAYDDAARRAVHAGHALLAGVRGLASTTLAQHGFELQARVGLHTGLVVVGEMGAGETRESGAIVGEAPNIAAHVQAVARPGTLALSAATRRLVEPAIRLRSLGLQHAEERRRAASSCSRRWKARTSAQRSPRSRAPRRWSDASSSSTTCSSAGRRRRPATGTRCCSPARAGSASRACSPSCASGSPPTAAPGARCAARPSTRTARCSR